MIVGIVSKSYIVHKIAENGNYQCMKRMRPSSDTGVIKIEDARQMPEWFKLCQRVQCFGRTA